MTDAKNRGASSVPASPETSTPAPAPAAAAGRRIVVAHAFTLTGPKGERTRYDAGVHDDVPADVADHWYTKAHLSKDGKVPFSAGGQANDDAERRRMSEQIRGLQADLDGAHEAAARVVQEQLALKARAEGAERGAEDSQGQIAALRKRVSDLEADNAALQVKVDAASSDASKGSGKAAGKGV